MRARIVGLLVLAALAACTGPAGEVFIGRWVHEKDPNQVLLISRTPDAFRIDTTQKPLWPGRPGKPVQVTATLTGGALSPLGWSGGRALTHIAESDSLAVQRLGGATVYYHRVQ